MGRTAGKPLTVQNKAALWSYLAKITLTVTKTKTKQQQQQQKKNIFLPHICFLKNSCSLVLAIVEEREREFIKIVIGHSFFMRQSIHKLTQNS